MNHRDRTAFPRTLQELPVPSLVEQLDDELPQKTPNRWSLALLIKRSMLRASEDLKSNRRLLALLAAVLLYELMTKTFLVAVAGIVIPAGGLSPQEYNLRTSPLDQMFSQFTFWTVINFWVGMGLSDETGPKAKYWKSSITTLWVLLLLLTLLGSPQMMLTLAVPFFALVIARSVYGRMGALIIRAIKASSIKLIGLWCLAHLCWSVFGGKAADPVAVLVVLVCTTVLASRTVIAHLDTHEDSLATNVEVSLTVHAPVLYGVAVFAGLSALMVAAHALAPSETNTFLRFLGIKHLLSDAFAIWTRAIAVGAIGLFTTLAVCVGGISISALRRMRDRDEFDINESSDSELQLL